MPRLPVPAGLEARLLATIPANRPTPLGRRVVRAGLVRVLAAACLLAVLAWPVSDGKKSLPRPETRPSARRAAPRPPEHPAAFAAWQESRRGVDREDLPTFTWPLPEPPPLATTVLPPELFD